MGQWEVRDKRRSASRIRENTIKGKCKNVANLETKAGEGRFEQIWNRVRDRLKADIGLQRFTYWIEPLRIVSASETRVVIACSSRFERDKVVESHGDRIAAR